MFEQIEEIESLINQSQCKLLIYYKVTEMIKLNEILPIEEEDIQNPLMCIHISGNENEDVDTNAFRSESKSDSNPIYGLSNEEQTDNTVSTKPETSIQNDPINTEIIKNIYEVFESMCNINQKNALEVYKIFKNYCLKSKIK
jgi:hypothetical protein